jgi:two-component sensor histidine kinase
MFGGCPMSKFLSETPLDPEALKKKLTDCDQECEQVRVALEDAHDEVRHLALDNARLKAELAQAKAEYSQLTAVFAHCYAELLELKVSRRQTGISPQKAEDIAVFTEELQTTIEELQVTAEELEAANTALRNANATLERQVAERTAHLERAIAERDAALLCKDRLISEIDHRVRNSLQLVTSLVRLQADRIPDPALTWALKATGVRIGAVAGVHDLLFAAGGSNRVAMGRYIREICTTLGNSLGIVGPRRVLEIEAENVDLPVDLAFPLALIVTELVTNACHHAFCEDDTGTVWVQFRRGNENILELMIADDGHGFPPSASFPNGVGLGLQIVALMAHQIGAELEIGRTGGSCFKLAIPMSSRYQESKSSG